MIADVKEIRTANINFKRHCQSRITRSPLHKGVKATLLLILDKILSPSNYTYSWASQKTLAEEQSTPGHKVHTNTITDHIAAIKATGILNVEPLTIEEANRLFQSKYGKPFEGFFKDRLNFYSLNKDHALWKADKKTAQAEMLKVVAVIEAYFEKRYKKRTRGAFESGNTRAGTSETPVPALVETPVPARDEDKDLGTVEEAVNTPSSPTPAQHSVEWPSQEGRCLNDSEEGEGDSESSDLAGDGDDIDPLLSKAKAFEGVVGDDPLDGDDHHDDLVNHDWKPEESEDTLGYLDAENLEEFLATID